MNEIFDFGKPNWIAIIVVTLLSFPIGSIWHSKLFGKAWKEDAQPDFENWTKFNYIRLFLFAAISHFILFTGLDVFIGVNSTWIFGLLKGLMISIIWISTSMGVTHAFAARKIRLIMIDTGFYVLICAIAGAILGAWS